MLKNIVLSVLSDDRPGIVEKLAETIQTHGGNWLESHMSQLAGKFAGVIQISIPSESLAPLQNALEKLQAQNIKVLVDLIDEHEKAAENSTSSTLELAFNIVGNDRPGIIHEFSRVIARTQVNVLELETHCSSMPWSGEPLFEANGLIAVPAHMSIADVELLLEPIATALGLDIGIEPRSQALP